MCWQLKEKEKHEVSLFEKEKHEVSLFENRNDIDFYTKHARNMPGLLLLSLKQNKQNETKNPSNKKTPQTFYKQ
jgi:hypothetical protein